MKNTIHVHLLDVWGNKRDGWDINNVYASKLSVLVPLDVTDDMLLRALCESVLEGVPADFTLEGSDYSHDHSVVRRKKDNKPIIQLRVA